VSRDLASPHVRHRRTQRRGLRDNRARRRRRRITGLRTKAQEGKASRRRPRGVSALHHRQGPTTLANDHRGSCRRGDTVGMLIFSQPGRTRRTLRPAGIIGNKCLEEAVVCPPCSHRLKTNAPKGPWLHQKCGRAYVPREIMRHRRLLGLWSGAMFRAAPVRRLRTRPCGWPARTPPPAGPL
jgi:hypothetical protein